MRSSRTSSTHKTGTVFLVLAVLLAAAALLSISLGAVWIPPLTVLQVLTGSVRNTAFANIILLTRLPRTLGCLLSGMCLAVSGTVIQRVLANPLAAPNVIGVNAGAGVAVAFFSGLAPAWAGAVPAAAFFGALAAVLLVLTIGEATGASRTTLVLAGVAVSAILSAIIDAAVTLVPEALNGYTDFRIGGFTGVTMTKLTPAFWVAAAAMTGILLMTNEMDVLALGLDTAGSLGLRVRPVRILLLVFAAALAGSSVSFSGLIGFVGLIVPHIMRRFLEDSARRQVLACAMGGAVLVTVCDVLSRVIFSPYELPAGIVLSCLGGPFFLWLLIRSKGGHANA